MSRGKNHKDNCSCSICMNIKTPNMGFQKGYKPSQEQREKQRLAKKNAIENGTFNYPTLKKEVQDKISRTNKIRMKKVIHHINGDHNDNRPENLMELSQSEHFKLHWKQGDIDGKKR